MKIGIHSTSGTFSERWVAYCETSGISFREVDCYSKEIIRQLKDCDALMWHFYQGSPKDKLFAKQLIFSVKCAGKKVFPDFHTMWHFDDKVGQKYLLEAIDAPLVPTWVFYDKKEALEWANSANYPIVFKLRCGAGSDNVRLVENRKVAKKLIMKAFGKGFSQYNALESLKERIRKFIEKKTTNIDILKGVIRFVYPPYYSIVAGREKGYIYFQKFIPENQYDIRTIVVGDKAFAIKRIVRRNDFRASGSGNILYEKKHFDDYTIRLSFEMADRLKTQCVAFDFVFDFGKPLVVEISYGFKPAAYDNCTGYWDRNLNWYEGPFNPYGWMIENLVSSIEKID